MKNKLKLALFSTLLLSSFAANAEFYNPAEYVAHNGINRLMNSATSYLSRMGAAATSATSIMTRANIGRAASLMLGRTPMGLIGGAVVGLLISNADYSLTANPDGTFDYTGIQTVKTDGTPAIIPGSSVWYPTANAGLSPISAYQIADPIFYISSPGAIVRNVTNNCFYSTDGKTFSCKTTSGSNLPLAYKGTSTVSCPAGTNYLNGACVDNGTKTETTTTTTSTIPVDELYQRIPQAVLDKPLTAEEEERLQQGFWGGIRNHYSAPVEPTISDLPSGQPATLRDYVEPISSVEQITPITNLPSTTQEQTPTNTNVKPIDPTKTEPEKEIDPGIQAPTLELDSPTANQILDPILNILPGFKNMTIQANAGSCYFSPFTIYGNEYSLNIFCDLLSANQNTINNVMKAFFMILSIIIILGA